jgi:glycosyltransferase involved in cell wall biosynthesis
VTRALWIWYTPFGLGGVETYLLNLTAESGPAAIAAIQRNDGPLRGEYDGLNVQLFDWRVFNEAFMGRRPADDARQRIADDLGRFRPDALLLNDCSDFGIGAAALLRRIRPYCTILDTFHIDPPDEGYFELRRPYLDVLDGVAATNRRVIERFTKFFRGESLPATRYIRNGVTVPQLPRKAFDGTLRLLVVGRVSQKQKRVLELPSIFASMREAGIAFEATIVGDGDERSALESALSQYGLDDRVRLTGFLPPGEVLRLYFEHDFLLNVSTYEGFSMSVIEALAAGCIPLCTDLPNLDREIVRDGENAILVGVEDLGAIAPRLQPLRAGDIERMSRSAAATGRELTAARTWDGYRAFIADLQARRPLAPWPEDVHALLDVAWDPTADNPWLPHPHPLRRWLDRLLKQ